ncbi:MAG: ketol-acid reductoisomerase, partial [Chloroflexota bacterium]
LELYGSGEAAEILGMMAKNGFYQQMTNHSTTSQYGTMSRAPHLLNDEIRAKMEASLVNDIKGGDFVKEWEDEQAAGSNTLAQLRERALSNPMSQAEKTVISLVQGAQRKQG